MEPLMSIVNRHAHFLRDIRFAARHLAGRGGFAAIAG
jgi:hypothetical protein